MTKFDWIGCFSSRFSHALVNLTLRFSETSCCSGRCHVLGGYVRKRETKKEPKRGNINTQFGSTLSLYVTSQKKNAGCLVVVDNAQHLCKMASSSCSAEEKRFEETTTTKEEEVSRGESGGSSRGGGSGRFVEAQ